MMNFEIWRIVERYMAISKEIGFLSCFFLRGFAGALADGKVGETMKTL